MLNIDELHTLKRNIHSIILKATNFMLEHGMDQENTKVRSTSEDYEKYGIWPTTEFLEFLLINDVIPTTSRIVNTIEGMIDFIVRKYDQEKKKWPLTDAEGSIASAITSGHCIYVLKLYISRSFVENERMEKIQQIIREAETMLIADCRQDGSWKVLEGDDTLDSRLNFGRFFYTYNAWFGIRKVQGYSDNLTDITRVRGRLSEYVIKVSDMLLEEFRKDGDVSKFSTLLCNMAKAIQILNDYCEPNCERKKDELCNSILQIVQRDRFKDILSTITPVEISELPNSGYTTFKNFPYFDLFFAVKDIPDYSSVVQDIIHLYIEGNDRDMALNCWWHRGSSANTWPTCEALLVLSQAHVSFFTIAIEHSCNQELVHVKEKYKACEGCKNQIVEYLKPQKSQFKETMNDCVQKVKKTSAFSIAITIFACLCAIAALVALSITLEKYWINTLITVVIIPLIMQIIFVIRIPEYSDKMQEVQKDILDKIDESEEMWKN